MVGKATEISLHIANDIPTQAGTARASLAAADPGRLLVLGHGAGGGIEAPDLLAVAARAGAAGWSVALVEQPYRVAGRRLPPRPPELDRAFVDVVTALTGTRPPGSRLVVGGRSSGARVACRTARELGADAVVALAFPLRPPWRPEQSRAGELVDVGVPVLVVQGEHDQFGSPADVPAGPTVVAVPGDHSLRRAADAAADAVGRFLEQVDGVGNTSGGVDV
jgi:predicted alpha/beta-hydrolase family hydrolase